jgi:hypothetical protein
LWRCVSGGASNARWTAAVCIASGARCKWTDGPAVVDMRWLSIINCPPLVWPRKHESWLVVESHPSGPYSSSWWVHALQMSCLPDASGRSAFSPLPRCQPVQSTSPTTARRKSSPPLSCGGGAHTNVCQAPIRDPIGHWLGAGRGVGVSGRYASPRDGSPRDMPSSADGRCSEGNHLHLGAPTRPLAACTITRLDCVGTWLVTWRRARDCRTARCPGGAGLLRAWFDQDEEEARGRTGGRPAW